MCSNLLNSDNLDLDGKFGPGSERKRVSQASLTPKGSAVYADRATILEEHLRFLNYWS